MDKFWIFTKKISFDNLFGFSQKNLRKQARADQITIPVLTDPLFPYGNRSSIVEKIPKSRFIRICSNIVFTVFYCRIYSCCCEW